MTTDTSRRLLRIVGPALGVDFTVRYAEILGQRLVDFAPRVREAAAGGLPAGAKLAFEYRDHHGVLTRAWPTDSMEWLMKRAPALTVSVVEPGDEMAV
jgi:hypothetical protein